MTIAAPPSGLQPEDYEEIEAAVMETARGRWFLAEYARRVRHAESDRMMAAIERLEARLEAQNALAPAEAFSVADRLTELSWSLRERGVEDFVCGKIDALARELESAGASAPGAAAPQKPSVEPHVTEADVAGAAIAAPEPRAAAADIASEPVTPIIEGNEPEPGPDATPPAIHPCLEALSWLDRLPLVDRLALFA